MLNYQRVQLCQAAAQSDIKEIHFMGSMCIPAAEQPLLHPDFGCIVKSLEEKPWKNPEVLLLSLLFFLISSIFSMIFPSVPGIWSLSAYGCVWKWLVPHTQWFCWSLSRVEQWLAIIGNIHPTFSGPKPNVLQYHLVIYWGKSIINPSKKSTVNPSSYGKWITNPYVAIYSGFSHKKWWFSMEFDPFLHITWHLALAPRYPSKTLAGGRDFRPASAAETVLPVDGVDGAAPKHKVKHVPEEWRWTGDVVWLIYD